MKSVIVFFAPPDISSWFKLTCEYDKYIRSYFRKEVKDLNEPVAPLFHYSFYVDCLLLYRYCYIEVIYRLTY